MKDPPRRGLLARDALEGEDAVCASECAEAQGHHSSVRRPPGHPDIAHPASSGRGDHVTHSLGVMPGCPAAGRVDGDHRSPDRWPRRARRVCRIPPIREETPWAGPCLPGSIGPMSDGRSLALLASSVGLGLAGWLLPGHRLRRARGRSFWRRWSWPWWAGDPAGAGRPRHARSGWSGALVLALLGQAIVAYFALSVVPGVPVDSFLDAFWATWIVSAVATLSVWVMTAGTDDAVLATSLRGARRQRHVADPDVPGILFVQADGVPFPVLDWGVRAGTLPTLSRWIRNGSHQMAEWRPKLPATTPASQMGILHGTIDGIPAFRWVDRPTGRVFVANKPGDAGRHRGAALRRPRPARRRRGLGQQPVHRRRADGVRDDERGRPHRAETRRPAPVSTEFLSRPAGFTRSMSRTLSEIARERFQASRGRAPRRAAAGAPRLGFAVERAALNGVMRDLNTTLVGRRRCCAGAQSSTSTTSTTTRSPTTPASCQPESLDALAGIDAVLAQLEAVAAVAPRKYHLVVLSDHGQSQGEIFADRYGEDLADAGRPARRHRPWRGTEVNAEGGGRLLTEEQPRSSPRPARRQRRHRRPGEAEESAAQAAVMTSSAAGAPAAPAPSSVPRLRLRQPRPGVRRRRGAPAHPGRARRAVAGPAARPGRAPGRVVRRRGHRETARSPSARAASTGCATES